MKGKMKKVIAILIVFSMMICGTIGNSSSVAEAEGAGRVIEVKEDTISQDSIAMEMKVTSEWEGHYNAEVTVRNLMNEPMDDWMVAFDFTDEIENIWNAQIVSHNEDGHYIVKNANWNQDIQPGEAAVFGMTVKYEDAVSRLTDFYDVTDLEETEKDYDVEYTQFSRWDNKVNGQITIHNNSEQEIRDWRLEFLGNITFEQVWNAEVMENDDGDCYVKNMPYNQNIPAGGEVSFGFIACCEEEMTELSDYSLYEIVLWDEMEEDDEEEEEEPEPVEDDEIIWEEEDFNTREAYEEYLKSRATYATYAYRSARMVSIFETSDDDDFVECQVDYDILYQYIPAQYTINYKGPNEQNPEIIVDKTITIEKIRNRAIQNFCIVGTDMYATQHSGENTFLMHFKLNHKKKTARFADAMILMGFGHGQSIQSFTHGGKQYLLLTCNIGKDPNNEKHWGSEIACIQYQKNTRLAYDERVEGQSYGLIKDLKYATDDGESKGAIKHVEFGLYGKKTLVLWKRKGKGGIQIAVYDISKKIGDLTSMSVQKDISLKKDNSLKKYYKYAKTKTKWFDRLYPRTFGENRSMQALDIVGNSKIYLGSGKGEKMSLTKLERSKKKLKHQLKYIDSTADVLPKQMYEAEGMQAEGSRLYYCLAPAKDGLKFPQYIVSVKR